jgi:predicted lysophospholipase L1 biosynthesis ABC-type transport system permease subunit
MRSWPTLIAVPGLLRLGSIAAIAASTLLLIVCTVREFSSHARHVTTLHTLGWSRTNARGVLVVQLTILAVVTILVGVGLGLLLLYLLLPFLASLGNEVLSLPILGITYLPTVTNISLLL